MTTRKRSGGAAAAAIPAAFMIATLVTPTGAAVAAPTPDYPTWDDVQNARGSEAATAAEVDRIEGILVSLEAQSAELGKQALIKDEQYAQAREALDATTRKFTALKDQVASAQSRADESAARAARLIAQMARSGGGDLSMGLMFGSPEDAEELLARLATADKLSESSAAILERAVFDRNLADSLADDAGAAEKLRRASAQVAEASYAEAKIAADGAVAQVLAQEAAASQMYDQLALLKNTSAETERAYFEGQAAPTVPPTPGTPTTPSVPATPGTPTSPSTPSTPTAPATPAAPSDPPPPAPTTPPPTPSPAAVAQAIAYAKAQLGDMYELGATGPDRWDCSGLTKVSYASAGIYIGAHGATTQYATMKSQGRLVSTGALQAGDLLFYSNGGSASGSMYHTALYIGGGQMIESPRPGVRVRIVAVRYGDLVPYAGRPTG